MFFNAGINTNEVSEGFVCSLKNRDPMNLPTDRLIGSVEEKCYWDEAVTHGGMDQVCCRSLREDGSFSTKNGEDKDFVEGEKTRGLYGEPRG